MNVMMIMRSQSGVPGGAGVPGGQIGMVQLARALARLGVRIELFVGGPRMGYLDGLDEVTTTYFNWPVGLDRLFKASPSRVQSFGKSLRRRRWLDAVTSLRGIASADVIHIQGLEDAEALLTRLDGPLVVTHWGRAGRWMPNGLEPAEREALRRRVQRVREAVKLVAIGNAQGEALAMAGMPPHDVIPPGIDLEHFRPGDRAEARGRVGFAADRRIVVYVGRFAADKSVDTLLKAFARLATDDRATDLVLIGEGPLRAELQRLSGELGISERTTFLPFVPHQELPSYYWAADVVVVPSNYLETFCMVALEAIACGCPVIVTDQVPEILSRFPTVPSVRPYDVETLRDRIRAVLHGEVQPADVTRMADYGWTEVGRRYIDFYRTALRTGS